MSRRFFGNTTDINPSIWHVCDQLKWESTSFVCSVSDGITGNNKAVPINLQNAALKMPLA